MPAPKNDDFREFVLAYVNQNPGKFAWEVYKGLHDIFPEMKAYDTRYHLDVLATPGAEQELTRIGGIYYPKDGKIEPAVARETTFRTARKHRFHSPSLENKDANRDMA
ncbi:MAG: hypothetical protein V1887_00805 [Candidatus Aenigmatarchaeota archaeon]